MKEQENEKSDSSSEKEVIADGQQAKVEIPDMYENVPEVELLLEDQESFTLLEGEKQIAKIPREDEEGTIDLMPVEQEKPLDLALVDKENDKDDDNSDAKEDDKIVTDEPSPVEEQEEAPLDVKPQELEEKLCAEEKSEQNLHEIDNSNDVVESVAESYLKEDNEEREVQTEEAEVVEKEEEEEEEEEEKEKEKVPDKKDEVASEGEAVIEPIKKDEVASEGEAVIEPIEIKEQVVEKKKQEPENVPSQAKEQEVVEKNKQEQENQAAQKQVVPRKRDSVVSNDMIEETANKLREQRKNRVRALAGAFESVISSQ